MILKEQPQNKYDVNKELKVTEYQFSQFTEPPEQTSVKKYKFVHLDKMIEEKKFDELQKVIRIERKYAENNQFAIEPIVSEFRGVRKQEEADYQERVDQKVKSEVDKIKESTIIDAREEGIKRAYEESHKLAMEKALELVDGLKLMIQEIETNKREILENQKQQLYKLIKILTKWIILREVSDDGQYIKRLLEKLILELDSRDNLLIKVNRDAFKRMPEFLNIVQTGLGELKNVRVEVDLDASKPGIVVESLSAIIDGSFDIQMKQLDELFKSVETYE